MLDFMSHATNCNCNACKSFRLGVAHKEDRRVAVLPHRQTIAKIDKHNGRAAARGGELKHSLGAALLAALR